MDNKKGIVGALLALAAILGPYIRQAVESLGIPLCAEPGAIDWMAIAGVLTGLVGIKMSSSAEPLKKK